MNKPGKVQSSVADAHHQRQRGDQFPVPRVKVVVEPRLACNNSSYKFYYYRVYIDEMHSIKSLLILVASAWGAGAMPQEAVHTAWLDLAT